MHAEVLAASVVIGGRVPLVAGAREARARSVSDGFGQTAVAAFPAYAGAGYRASGVRGNGGHAVALHCEGGRYGCGRHALELHLETAGVLPGVVDDVEVAERAVDGRRLCLRDGAGGQREAAEHGGGQWVSAKDLHEDSCLLVVESVASDRAGVDVTNTLS